MKKITALALLLSLVFALTACGGANTNTNTNTNTNKSTNAPAATPETDISELTAETVGITITLADGRAVKAELYPKLAPITVENFTKLCNEHFYDGLIFHRVISGFMIQGGGMDENMSPRQADTIKGEFEQNGVANPLEHTRGVISMARTALSMDSASSQFFIMHEDAPHLDGQYAAFGKVTEGMDIVDEIAAVQTDSNDAPLTPVVIKSITVD